ncbi:hypothetical protein F2Q69_00013031 [Brassica cretica]|uniref:Sugar phosphate transporter domain-containing protein n=1 Tax=Brassica cretica TaxID=69181 RepID=A0A8S9QWK0_BRACR|nr:hypothetical protein F2Q69_00013031 [Brassica cretica]
MSSDAVVAQSSFDALRLGRYVQFSISIWFPRVEGHQLLKYGFSDAITKVGVTKFISDLLWVGMFYHLYNQLATNTLERVAPLTHAVRNILKRVFVIGFAIVIFGNKILTQTDIGTAIAIAGVALYSIIKAKIEEDKKVNSLFIVIFLKT